MTSQYENPPTELDAATLQSLSLGMVRNLSEAALQKGNYTNLLGRGHFSYYFTIIFV
jgi:hypothetical protein